MARLSLPQYNDRYPAPLICADIAILTVEQDAMKVVMTNLDYMPPGSDFALPGDCLLECISLEDFAAMRVHRRLGLHGIELHQIGTFSDPDRDDRGRVVAAGFVGVVGPRRLREAIEVEPGYKLVSASLQPSADIATLCLRERHIEPAFDHAILIAKAIQWLRDQLDTSMLAFNFLPDTFTLHECPSSEHLAQLAA